MTENSNGGSIADKYELNEVLADGVRGRIHRGRNAALDRPVIIKIADAADVSLRQSFAAEARTAAGLSHPNVAAVSDFGTDAAGSVYIVFEGGDDATTLERRLSAEGRLTVERAVALAWQIASAQDELRRRGIEPGTLTPDRILVGTLADGTEYAKLFDLLGGVEERDPYSVRYAAPETFAGRPPDQRSDVYGLGIIVYRMLAGDVPFIGTTATDTILKHTEEPLPPLADSRKDISPEIETVIRKALSKDPAARYASPVEFAEQLRAARTPPKRDAWKTAFLVLGGIAVLASALIYGTSGRRSEPVTQLQTDVNGVPVQPLNPATGIEEQRLAAASAALPTSIADAMDMTQPPGTLPGGDGYNAWGNGTAPPPGAPPAYIPPGGQVYTIDPNTGSPFMPPDGGVVLVPVPANTAPAAKPTPTPKNAAASNSNTAAPPAERPASQPKPDAAPAKTPVPVKPKPETSGSGEPKTID